MNEFNYLLTHCFYFSVNSFLHLLHCLSEFHYSVPKKIWVKQLENDKMVNPHCLLPLVSLVCVLIILVRRRNVRIELTDIPHTCSPQHVKFPNLPSQLTSFFVAKEFAGNILLLLQAKLYENHWVFLEHFSHTLVVILVFLDG
jgi:hypothetical protein